MIAYFDCFSGVSGDMMLGALLDAGFPLAFLEEQLALVDLHGYRVEAPQREEQGIRGTQLEVVLESRNQPPRGLPDIVSLIERSRLDPRVAKQACAVFRRLARAESVVHGVNPEEVQFHELGAVDTIVDVVGAAAGLSWLGVEQVYASALPLGGGSVKTQHGTLPLPAPGTLQVLAERGVPTRPIQSERELVTPTGAAILAELATFEQPPLVPRRVGYGFGQTKLPWPNCLRVWLGEPLGPALGRDEVVLIEANLDDMAAEGVGYAMERLLGAGALDVFFQPVQMKKNRPGVVLSVLAHPGQKAELAALLLAETTTLGVRISHLERFLAARHSHTVQTELGAVKVKVKQLGDRRVMSPEYDDAARIARTRGVPLADVYRAVQRADVPEDVAKQSST